MVDQLGEQGDEHQHQNRRDNHHQLGGGADDIDGLCQKTDGGVGHGLAAGDVGRSIFKQIADADGGDHNRHSGRAAQGLVGRSLNEKAQCHRQHDDNGNRNVNGNRRGNVNAQQARDHKHIAVGKVNQTQNTVNHGVANGNQGQLTAKRDTAEQNGYEIFSRNQLFHAGSLQVLCPFSRIL